MNRAALLALVLMAAGCARDPFHVETHYPDQYYRHIEREDERWLNGKLDQNQP